MARKLRIGLLALVVILLLAMLTTLILPVARTSPRPPAPSPNGCDDFLRAAGLVRGDPAQASTMDQDSLRNLVLTNAESLRLLRVGLSRQCAFPTDSFLTNLPGTMPKFAVLKRLAQVLVAEGRLQEMENRPADAARSYADVVWFGNQLSHGGPLIVRLIGVACESMGCHGLAQIVPKLTDVQAHSLLAELVKIDAGRVTWDEVRRTERYCTSYHMTKQPNPIVWVGSWWQARTLIRGAEARHKLVVAQERLLAGELALRCYQIDQGRIPTRLEELVTNYLSSVPQDPFASQPLVYRPQGTNWLLYSFGPDGVDDGGKSAGPSPTAKGDLVLDSSW